MAELGDILNDTEVGTPPFATAGDPPATHNTAHEDGGGDEISVAGLSGVLADPQNPVAASETVVGGAELATQAETDAGTDDTRIVTPLKLALSPAAGGSALLSATWSFDTGTADADPGNKSFRFNNGTQSAATFIFVNDTAESGVDASTILLALTTNDRIYIQRDRDSTKFHLVRLTGPAVNGGTYVKLPIVVENSGTDFSNNDTCVFIVAFTGSGSVPDASETVKGIAELATQGETDAGTDDTRIVTPLKLANNPHATRHENGGSDEIDVAGLSGVLSDPQTPAAHNTSHENGGGDEIDVAGLSGKLADAQDPVVASESVVGGAELATQAETDARLDDARIVTPLKLGVLLAKFGTLEGARLAFNTVAIVDIGPGFVADSTRAAIIEWSGTLSATITASGANGLDTGSEASSTWYAVHVIGDTTGVNAPASLLSLSASAPTLPGTHDVFRRVGWVRNNSTSNIIKFFQNGNGRDRFIDWDAPDGQYIIENGVATSATALSAAAYVPPSSNRCRVNYYIDSGGGTNDYLFMRRTGMTEDFGDYFSSGDGTAGGYHAGTAIVTVNDSQQLDYAISPVNGDVFIGIQGYEDQL